MAYIGSRISRFNTADKLTVTGTSELKDNVTVTGTVTATSFSGDGSTLTGINTDLVDDTTPQLGGALDTNNNNINFGDNDRAVFGAGSDLQIWHSGLHSYIDDAGTGNLYIRAADNLYLQKYTGETYIQATADGEVRLTHNNNTKLQTKSDGVDITGELQADSLDIDGAADITGFVTLRNNLSLQDNDKIQLGNSGDLEIYHNGSNSYVEDVGAGVLVLKSNGTGTYIQNTSNNNIISALSNEARLHYNGSVKLVTKSDGVDITGELQADSLDIDGAADITGNITANNYLLSPSAATVGTASDTSIEMRTSADGTPAMIFRANGSSERMRIDSSGNVLIGKTSAANGLTTAGFDVINGNYMTMTNDSGVAARFSRLNSDGDLIQFNKGSTLFGKINTSGQIFTRSEGGTNNIVELRQGSAKAWLNNKQYGGNSTRDSYNISSVTDHGTGDFAPQINNDMDNRNYAWTAAGQRGDHPAEDLSIAGYTNTFNNANVTSSTRLASYHSSSANHTDALANNVVWHGDLA